MLQRKPLTQLERCMDVVTACSGYSHHIAVRECKKMLRIDDATLFAVLYIDRFEKASLSTLTVELLRDVFAMLDARILDEAESIEQARMWRANLLAALDYAEQSFAATRVAVS
jgi:hypothetical protein